MSSVTKGVGKVFKKVAKVAKVVVPVALAAAAVYFTAGAALGVAGTAGGWGAAVSGITGSIGGTMGSIVTGAVTQAGYGAAIGAATSALTGGNIAKGALMGAATGAVTGGVTGGIGMSTDPLAGIGTEAAPAGVAAPVAPTPQISGAVAPNAVGPSAYTGAPAWGAASGSGGATGGLLGPGGWVERNGTLVGNTVGGIGTGLLAGMSEDGHGSAERHKGARYSGNYSLTGAASQGGLLPRAAASQLRSGNPQNPTMAEKYDPLAGGHIEYRYNDATNTIDRVRVA